MHNSGLTKGFAALRKFGVAVLVSAPAWAVLSAAIPAHPGMLNYVEGQATIAGQPVTSKQVGTAEVEQGQTIETGAGKAEILLTPGVFLRVGDNSAVRFDAAGLTNTQVEVVQGKAMVEATDLKENNNVRITDRGTVTTLQKNGLYQFDANQGTVSVYDGKAQVRENDRTVDLKKGKSAEVSSLKVEKFDRKDTDDLYRWSDLRSQYLSEASASSARTYIVGGSGWSGGGWYWNPYYSFYSYLPGDGFLYSPFGYGFYSPLGLRNYYYGGGYGYRAGGFAYHSGDRSGNFGRNSFQSNAPVRSSASAASFGRASADLSVDPRLVEATLAPAANLPTPVSRWTGPQSLSYHGSKGMAATESRVEDVADEAELIAQAKTGNARAFGNLLERYERKIFRLAQHITQNREDAEDVLQETFLKAYEHLDQFQGNSKFYTWIVRIAVNQALMKLRKRKTDRTVSMDEGIDTGEDIVVREIAAWDENPEQRYSRDEMNEILSTAVDSLAPAYRTVFVLRDVEELSTEETAEALELSIPAVKSRLLRARLQLRDKLTKFFKRKGEGAFAYM